MSDSRSYRNFEKRFQKKHNPPFGPALFHYRPAAKLDSPPPPAGVPPTAPLAHLAQSLRWANQLIHRPSSRSPSRPFLLTRRLPESSRLGRESGQVTASSAQRLLRRSISHRSSRGEIFSFYSTNTTRRSGPTDEPHLDSPPKSIFLVTSPHSSKNSAETVHGNDIGLRQNESPRSDRSRPRKHVDERNPFTVAPHAVPRRARRPPSLSPGGPSKPGITATRTTASPA